MSTKQEKYRVPIEIILDIIAFVVPASYSSNLALAPRNPSTRTLLSLTLTSRAIYPVARRLLYAHCVYIHTGRRLSLFLGALADIPGGLRPLQPPEHLLSSLTSLYLRPVSIGRDDFLSIDTAKRTEQLMKLVGPGLRRLLLDMPLRGNIYPEDDTDSVRQILRSAFVNLPALEEFCSVRDELYLETRPRHTSKEFSVWSQWPKLKTLALYNQDVNDVFLSELQKSQQIETVILTRSDGLEQIDLKQVWNNQSANADVIRRLQIVLVNFKPNHAVLLGRDRWKENDSLQVRELCVPILFYGDEDCILLCQQWVKKKFISGHPVSKWI
jgi:hypothetical protein